ncbi:MAG: pilus assembly protein [Chloroflexi bacterium]|nr:pilus assembly protein [Chloroflexota bacterium]
MKTLHRDERGQSLVELALILPVLMLIVTGLFDVARAVWQENTLAYAAREGTRYAIVHGSAAASPVGPTNTSDPTIAAIVRAAAIGVPNITITTSWPDLNNDRNSRVSVDASAPFVPLPSQYLLGGAFQITLRGGSLLIIER